MKIIIKNKAAFAVVGPVLDVAGLAHTDEYKLAAANGVLVNAGDGALTTTTTEDGRKTSTRDYGPALEIPLPDFDIAAHPDPTPELTGEDGAYVVYAPLPKKIPTMPKGADKGGKKL